MSGQSEQAAGSGWHQVAAFDSFEQLRSSHAPKLAPVGQGGYARLRIRQRQLLILDAADFRHWQDTVAEVTVLRNLLDLTLLSGRLVPEGPEPEFVLIHQVLRLIEQGAAQLEWHASKLSRPGAG